MGARRSGAAGGAPCDRGDRLTGRRKCGLPSSGGRGSRIGAGGGRHRADLRPPGRAARAVPFRLSRARSGVLDGPGMWDDPGPVGVPRIEPLLDALAAAEPTPGSGSAAALAGAMAAAVCAKVARLSGDGGASAQAVALSSRLSALAEEDARLFRLALDELDRRDDDFIL